MEIPVLCDVKNKQKQINFQFMFLISTGCCQNSSRRSITCHELKTQKKKDWAWRKARLLEKKTREEQREDDVMHRNKAAVQTDSKDKARKGMYQLRKGKWTIK